MFQYFVFSFYMKTDSFHFYVCDFLYFFCCIQARKLPKLGFPFLQDSV